tara:strand:- start:54 stop:734 length:681 start_codon:yes stop_codon:yes gene_type:complete
MNKNWRYERKFLIENISKRDIELFIKQHHAMFYEIYNERYIRNIYFDTPGFKNYYDNIDGNSERIKVRIRWYGNFFGEINEPKLEIKIKNGLLGYKKIFDLPSFELFIENIKYDNLIEMLNLNNNNPNNIDLRIFSPAILNGYKRKYFLSADKKYRITLDTNQIIYQIFNKNNIVSRYLNDKESIILEIKYNQEEDENAQKITSSIPFRLSKNSKYVNVINHMDFL